jgi:hypothetical protein
MAQNDGPNHVVYRSSETGRIVTKEYAEAHPKKTYADTVPDRKPDPNSTEGDTQPVPAPTPEHPTTVSDRLDDGEVGRLDR